MAKFSLILFLAIPLLSFSQIQDPERAEAFWKDNVHAILAGEMEKVLTQTQYPLTVTRNFGVETTSHEAWTKAQFKAKYDEVFTAPILAYFEKKDFSSIDASIYGDDILYMVIYGEVGIEEGVVFAFSLFNGEWKLHRVDYYID